ncbi:MAG TPA: cation-translocating P-type ATPase [Gemmatimonadaceae bacterium]|nr:cation-translocating P-type ATPase [Gemmatimonadaceae bacterium]
MASLGPRPSALGESVSAEGRGPRAEPHRCPHCGTAVEGAADAYCCAGCEAAAAIIRGAGLDRYYAEREAYAPRPEGASDGWDGVPVETLDDGSQCVRLQVDGLRCASCVWLVERVLEGADGVREARVSYASGRASLRWDPARTSLAALAGHVAALGYRPRVLGIEARPDRDLLARTVVAGVLALALMAVYEPLYGGWWYGDIPLSYAQLFRWLSLALATPLAVWCAAPFYAGAWAGLRARVLHMDLPVSLGVLVMYVHGAAATLRRADAYLDSLGMLVALLLVGRVLETRGRRRAAEAATALAASVPRVARRRRESAVESVPVDQLARGDTIEVGAGEELPADGAVLEGSAQLRTALLTGESLPVVVRAGDVVHAGTVVLEGSLAVRVDAVGEETVLRQMAARLEEAVDRGARPGLGDRLAPWFTTFTLVAATLTLAGWGWARGIDAGVAACVAVLVVACPCALALARPLAAAAGLGAAARRGILFRDADSLLTVGDATLVALDKTGTVTEGAMLVTDAADDVLRIAAGLERYSAHPIARAIVTEAVRRGIPLPAGLGVHEEAGVGVRGVVDGRRWAVRAGGPGEVLLVDDAGAARTIRLGDVTRGDSAATVAALRGDGVELVLLTGDHADVATRVAAEAGIARVEAAMSPERKAAWIDARRAEGARVLFAGDGLNDGPALAAADVGIAMGTGAASSVLVADAVVSTASLSPLLAARRAARAARRTIGATQRQSLVYNVLFVLAAAAGLVNPLVAAILMPLSSAAVVWRASRVEALVRGEER